MQRIAAFWRRGFFAKIIVVLTWLFGSSTFCCVTLLAFAAALPKPPAEVTSTAAAQTIAIVQATATPQPITAPEPTTAPTALLTDVPTATPY
jgi:hypothetical protein